MMSKGMQAGIRQFLPLCAAICILSTDVSSAQEKSVSKLPSPIDEPHVVIQDSPHKVPVRAASREITESTDPLVKLVYETREAQRRRLLSTSDHTPWQIMHGVLGLRQDFLISHNGKPVSGIEWIQSGPTYMNESWFEKTAHGGRAHPFSKPYWFEGHINQFVGILAICNVPLDTQFGTPQGPVTMREMLKNAQMTANEKEEVTWTLWALCTYLPADAEWVNAKGERWSIERLVRLEVGKQVGGPTSPCGGTHGLFALARARNVYLRSGKPLRGVWLEADQKVQKYIETARMLQNQDGTLSSNFFRGREYKQDFDKRMASCGHVLEFLMMAMPQERLKEPWIRKAIEATSNDLMANRKAYVSCSPLYHATDALSIYLERVAPAAQPQVAQQPGDVKSISSSKPIQTADASSSKPITHEKTSTPPANDKTAVAVTPQLPVSVMPKSTAQDTKSGTEPVVDAAPIRDLELTIPSGDIPQNLPATEPIPENLPPVEEPKAEEPKAEEPKAEEPKAEEPKAEEPKAEEPKAEEPKAEEPKAEEPKAEEPKAEEPKAEEPKAEEPKAEEPKAEEPKAEEPKAEEPKAEEPKAEEPKAEEPKAEEPKAEEPKAEEPKAEEDLQATVLSTSPAPPSGNQHENPALNSLHPEPLPMCGQPAVQNETADVGQLPQTSKLTPIEIIARKIGIEKSSSAGSIATTSRTTVILDTAKADNASRVPTAIEDSRRVPPAGTGAATDAPRKPSEWKATRTERRVPIQL